MSSAGPSSDIEIKETPNVLAIGCMRSSRAGRTSIEAASKIKVDCSHFGTLSRNWGNWGNLNSGTGSENLEPKRSEAKEENEIIFSF